MPVEDCDVVRVRSSVVDEASVGVSGLRGAGAPAPVRADVLALGASRSRNLAGRSTHTNSACICKEQHTPRRPHADL